ncbi:NAD(P)H-dependent oxidoreductase [candidate division KSB1 bacterium]|nr:NAD(P)H-dependent oxidoreductase [candidate division KSB1 bacterium]
MNMNIVAISGSLRKGSYNTALLRAAQKLAPELNIEILDISTLPIYNQDVEAANYPAEAKALREKIASADGVLIATPEFNRTPPGPLKNFLDWSSRPESEPLPWEGKPVGVLGASSSARGASFAQYDIRRIMSYFNAHPMGTAGILSRPCGRKIRRRPELDRSKINRGPQKVPSDIYGSRRERTKSIRTIKNAKSENAISG